MATLPGYYGALVLWGFYGVTTILLFWAALIRATREWGGSDEQGRAYGFLEGGRGLLAAVLASIAVLSFGLVFPEGYAVATLEQKQDALRTVIYGYTLVTAASGVFVWFVVSDGHPRGEPDLADWDPEKENVGSHVGRVLRMPAVWLQATIVICAYVGYKGFDNYSLYAVEGYGMDEVEAARLVAIGSWLRPVAAVAAGLLGDRFTVSRMTALAFGMLLASTLFFAIDSPQPAAVWILFGNTLLTCAAIFGLRGLYFALFEEAGVPGAVTGTAVGLVSVLGFTPDIFVTYVGGVLLDRSPGLEGHQHFFFFLATFAAIGLLASITLICRLYRAGRS
jgi:nitrate/nitrite transporter NarK